MKVAEIIGAIEQYAPPIYQESYDNCGLQIGDSAAEATGALICLDITEAILDEALERNCNLIIAHHPLLFTGLKRITGRNYVERVVIKAIKNNLNLFAAHTSLDNMHNGVNAKIAEKLGLVQTSILAPKPSTLSKLYTYVPVSHAHTVRDALFAAGAGHIGNYSECSFNTPGTGTFKGNEATQPFIGTAGGERETAEEYKIEVLVPKHAERTIINALKAAHPYEEVAYELIPISNTNQNIGAGMVGNLLTPLPPLDFLALVKRIMNTGCIRHTALGNKAIERVALCGGAGSFLLPDAIKAKADIFITADYKYHQFFDAENQIIIADIGHYESEQFTSEIFESIIKKKYPNFAVLLSNLSTNPVKYFC